VGNFVVEKLGLDNANLMVLKKTKDPDTGNPKGDPTRSGTLPVRHHKQE
jgi:hypothetical protein